MMKKVIENLKNALVNSNKLPTDNIENEQAALCCNYDDNYYGDQVCRIC